MSGTVRIGDRDVGAGHPPLIVAELSANHGGSLDTALALVDAAADAGADACKLQTYTAGSMTLDADRPEFTIDDPASLWHGRTLHELYREGTTPWEWHAPIMERCRARGLLCFSTPFDADAVARLDSAGVPAHKIASFELVDLPLIRRAAASGKPLILSTGMATLEEIELAVQAAAGAELVLLRCTSAYPAPPGEADLRTLPDLAARFGVPVGLSDHTLGLAAPLAAVALGAALIEKHVTLDRRAGTLDAAFSLEPPELAALVTESRRAWEALGTVRYGPAPSEEPSLAHRRSLYVTADLVAGDVLTSGNLRAIRPAAGLAPAHLDDLLGRRVRRAVSAGTPASWDLVEP